jgi:hypothetical protein
MRRSMCAGMLSLQAVVLMLTTPVMISLGGVDTSVALAVGGGLTVASILAAGMLRRDWAYYVGFAIQAASLGLGFLVTPMFALGSIFGALWITAYVMGGRIDADQQAAVANS